MDAQDDTVRNESNAKRQAWLARAPSSYVVAECGYGAVLSACSVQAVDSGRVVASSSHFLPTDPWVENTGDTATPETEDPIAALFTELETPIDGCKTSYQLDDVYAYPSQIYFDCGEEGWGTHVTCFERDTLDLERCQ